MANKLFRLRIREGSVDGNVVATTDYITFFDVNVPPPEPPPGPEPEPPSFGGGLDSVRFATGNGLIFKGVIIKYT
jgi:hypothetical protein